MTNYAGFAHEVQRSVNRAFEEIRSNSFDKKLFNLINNDLSGILKKSGLQSYSFDFKGKLLSDEFVLFFVDLLQKCDFVKERWDKRLFKDNVTEFLSRQDDKECFKSASILGFNDQMIEFLYKVKAKYGNN